MRTPTFESWSRAPRMACTLYIYIQFKILYCPCLISWTNTRVSICTKASSQSRGPQSLVAWDPPTARAHPQCKTYNKSQVVVKTTLSTGVFAVHTQIHDINHKITQVLKEKTNFTITGPNSTLPSKKGISVR